jgi:hypothetical protein
MLLTQTSIRADQAVIEPSGEAAIVVACLQERLSNCAYSYYFSRITWHYARGTLTLEGRVPTFYLKQILQTILRDIDYVQRIANDVDVVSSTGLSSEREAEGHWPVPQRIRREVNQD